MINDYGDKCYNDVQLYFFTAYIQIVPFST